MRAFTRTIWISRPPDAVFDFFVDFDRGPEWRSYVRTMRRLDSGPIAAGSRIHVTMDLASEDYSFELEVLACDRPSRWRHQADEVDLISITEYTFEAEKQGTLVTMRTDVKPASAYGWLSLPLIWLHRNRPYRDQLPKLKQIMESAD
jgi:uncharacterized protein YndB with AHSA1/START domain